MIKESSAVVTRWQVLVWILCLAALAVGARNFELGLSLDAPLYATISRNMALGGSWFRMNCSLPDFSPFAEHPHLGMWVGAVVFKVFPMADWSIRIPGHLLYVAFLFFFFGYVKRKSGTGVATLTVLLLWTFHLFANVFSTFYLDPGVLFFGMLSMIHWEEANLQLNKKSALLSGLFFALAVLYKGITIVGFGPAYLWLALWGLYRNRHSKQLYLNWGLFLGVAAAPILLYYFAVRASDFPDFFEAYWQRQVTLRFSQVTSFWNIFRWDFWLGVWKYTNFLLPLAFLTVRRLKSRPEFVAAWLIPSTFLLQVAAAGLTPGQYLIMALPWIAWLISETLNEWLVFPAKRFMKISAVVALVALFIIQYIPISTHGARPKPEYFSLARLSDAGEVKHLYLDFQTSLPKFIIASSFAWYGKVDITYPTETPKAEASWAYFLSGGDPLRPKELVANGWCHHFSGEIGQVYLPCR